MLLVSAKLRSSVFVPVGFVLLMGSMTAVSTIGVLEKPSIAAAFGWIVLVAMFSFVVSMIVVARVDGDRLYARSLFGTRRWCDLASVAVGFRVHVGSKGGLEYTIQASDGRHLVELATAWTRAGAYRDVRRLSEAFGLLDSPSRRAAHEAMAAELDAWDRQQAEVKARLAASYSSPRTWMTALVVVGLFGMAYAIAMAFILANR